MISDNMRSENMALDDIRGHMMRLAEKRCDDVGWDEMALYKIRANHIIWVQIQTDMISLHQKILDKVWSNQMSYMTS